MSWDHLPCRVNEKVVKWLQFTVPCSNTVKYRYCRRWWTIWCGQKDGSCADHRFASAEGQRIFTECHGCWPFGESKSSCHPFHRSRTQSSTIYQRILHNIHTRKHAWGTAVSNDSALTRTIFNTLHRKSPHTVNYWLFTQYQLQIAHHLHHQSSGMLIFAPWCCPLKHKVCSVERMHGSLMALFVQLYDKTH